MRGTSLENMTGFDLGKRFFQMNCADDRGKKLLNRRLRRDQIVAFFESLPRVAMETCAGAWDRVLSETRSSWPST